MIEKTMDNIQVVEDNLRERTNFINTEDLIHQEVMSIFDEFQNTKTYGRSKCNFYTLHMQETGFGFEDC